MSSQVELENCLTELQKSLAEVDLLTQQSSGHGLELLILRFLKIAIRMDRNQNHARPHFHIDYDKSFHSATYAVDNGERLAGTLPRKYDRRIAEWSQRNKTALMELWTRMRNDTDYTEVLVKLSADNP